MLPVAVLLGDSILKHTHAKYCGCYHLQSKWAFQLALMTSQGPVMYLVFGHLCVSLLIQLLPVANRKFQPSINKFNFWIRSLKQKKGVTVLAFQHIFDNEVTSQYFKGKYCTTIKGRPDYLHPNSRGLHEMHLALQGVLGCLLANTMA